MPSKPLPNTTNLRFYLVAGALKLFDYCLLTVIDTLLYAFYALQNNVVNRHDQESLTHRKRVLGKSGFLMMLCMQTAQDVEWRISTIPFIIRFVPTAIALLVVWIF